MLARKGIPSQILNAWSGALDGLQRQVQVIGFLSGNEQSSTTGFPEGDPLGVTALVILVWNFGAFLYENHQGVEFRAYADNLELLGHNTLELVNAFDSLITLAKTTNLAISADKSWSWAKTTDARIFLARKLHIDHLKIAGSYSEKILGAAVRYSCKKFAKVRHSRWKEGFRRFECLETLPISREFRARIILGGVFPQCLHGVEAEIISEKAWTPLRSRVTKALGFRCTRNPFLACVTATKRIVDSLVVSVRNGIRLCRLVAKHSPSHIDGMLHCFGQMDGKCHGVATILACRLKILEWQYEKAMAFGRCVV